MTNEQVTLVQQSFRAVADLPHQVVSRLFFTRLVENLPRFLSPCSPLSYPNRSTELMTVLTYVVSQLHQLDHLVGDLTGLVRRYGRYGVVQGDYVPIGKALLSTLEELLGAGWTPNVNAAWTACYTLLAKILVEAAPLSISRSTAV